MILPGILEVVQPISALGKAFPAGPRASDTSLPADLEGIPCRVCPGGCKEVCACCEDLEAWESLRKLKEHQHDVPHD